MCIRDSLKTGDEFYVKLPEKIDKVIILTGVIKTEFTSMANQKSYYELGKGTTTYHPFSVEMCIRDRYMNKVLV